jgi:hypothetical protein
MNYIDDYVQIKQEICTYLIIISFSSYIQKYGKIPLEDPGTTGLWLLA